MASHSHGRRARVGLVGLSGYAEVICQLLRGEGDEPRGRTVLSDLFVPDPEKHAALIDELRGAGVVVHGSYEALLAGSAEAVWLPTPIHLHRPMTEATLAAGKAVMLEKPVAGCIDDHDAIAAAAKDRAVLVGFQDIYRPNTAALKRCLIDGMFGKPMRAVVHGIWPRPASYYQRNDWAGALRRHDTWVLDSPLNNAMAHFVNQPLFLLGPTLDTAATVARVTVELWRARPGIENFDTCSLRVGLGRGGDTLDLVVIYTHAGRTTQHPQLDIDTDRGTLSISFDGNATFTTHDGETQSANQVDDLSCRPPMARALGAAVLGDEPDVAVATLATSRAHSVLVSAVSEAA
ncbi:MAG: Gfo/Idh/MocA family oxidoreductase, partial [Planctomycetota bacterium]